MKRLIIGCVCFVMGGTAAVLISPTPAEAGSVYLSCSGWRAPTQDAPNGMCVVPVGDVCTQTACNLAANGKPRCAHPSDPF